MTRRAEGPRPPRAAERILQLLVGRDPRGRSILGDAREEMATRWRDRSRVLAALWYWGYVARFAFAYRGGGGSSGLSLGAGIRHAVRGLSRRPGFGLVVVVTLAVGIGATTLAFAMVDGVLVRPLPYPHSDELVNLSRVDPDWFSAPPGAADASGWFATPPATFFDWEKDAHSFTHLGAYAGWSGSLEEGDEPVRVYGAVVTSGVFAALGVPAERGRYLVTGDDVLGAAPVVVLSHGLWMRRFGGDPGVVGRAIRLDDTEYTVVGVMPQSFGFPGESTDLWIHFGDSRLRNETRSAGYLNAVGRLAPGVGLEEARADLSRVTAEISTVHPEERDFEVLVFPLREVTVAGAQLGLLLLLGSALMVLLVGCANVTSLLLTRSAERRREFAVHAALGAGSGRLAGLVLGESLVLAGLGGLLGGLLARVSLAPFIAALPMTVPRAGEIAIDGRVVLVVAALTVGLAALVALLPALQTGRSELNATLREGALGASGGRRGLRSHGTIVVVEVALAVLLLSVSGMFLESYRLSMARDPGYRVEGAVSMYVSVPQLRRADGDEIHAFFDNLTGRLASVPGAEGAALASQMPLMGSYSMPPAAVETSEGVEETILHSSVVSPSYFEVMGIPVLAGRSFDATDAGGEESVPVAVVSEALAQRYWPGQNPVGKRIRIGTEADGVWHQVVGMVGNVRYGFARSEALEYYRAAAQYPQPAFNVVLRAKGDLGAVAAATSAVIRGILPNVPVSVEPLRDRARSDRNYRWARLASILLGGLAGVAVLLSVLGIYGVLSYAVVRRTREIGIRMSLGGTAGEILRSVLGFFLALSGVGIALGVGLAVVTGSLVRSALVGAVPTGPWILGGVAVLVLATVVVASLVPALRALRVDPVVAFKLE
ncbi:MAG: ADOP family duplicated permease [Gemmatimonadetes bacterium]|nr:ADOP family duplicated permease [Gemmatimonadota bacterium]